MACTDLTVDAINQPDLTGSDGVIAVDCGYEIGDSGFTKPNQMEGTHVLRRNVTEILISALVLAVAILNATVLAETTPEVIARITQQIDQSEVASAPVKALAKEKLLPLCTNAIFVKAVKAQNAKNLTLDQVKKIDSDWTAAEDELPIQKELMNNECAAEIRRLAKEFAQLTETFVMDQLGANVGQNALTSDYWQGDEPKWANSFNAGNGGVDIDKPKLDKSTNREDQKISLPIIDETGKVIGAICCGIALN